jgi:hypothetical protein
LHGKTVLVVDVVPEDNGVLSEELVEGVGDALLGHGRLQPNSLRTNLKRTVSIQII